MRLLVPALLLIGSLGCTDYSLWEPPTADVAQPPGDDQNDAGDPPNFQDCSQGYFATYYNLPPDHPDVEPLEASLPGVDPNILDWWDDDYFAYEKYDPSLEFGANWWPVDEGIAGDPDYYSVKWNGWLRAFDDGDVDFVLGASTDAWLIIEGQVVQSIEGAEEFEAVSYTQYVDSGVYPIEIRYTHRMGDAGFRFRVTDGDVVICFPDYAGDEAE